MSWKSGFTLLESTIVIGIISLLLTIGTNVFVFSKQAARDSVRKTDIEQIRAALEFYKEEDTNRYYPALISGLSNTYMDKIPQDPLINTQYEYCYSLNPDTDSTNYIVAAELERGGPSSCNCNNLSYNYCFTPYGILLTPTPSLAPVTQPPQSTTPPATTLTPILVPDIQCFDTSAKKGEIAVIVSDNSNAYWTMDSNNPLSCNEIIGGGLNFVTTCQIVGTVTINVENTDSHTTDTCQLTIIP